MTPEETDRYIDAVILKTLDENPGLSGADLCRYAISVGLEDCHANATNADHRCALEVLMVTTLSPENIYRRCDVLLESGDVRFDVEEDAWFSVQEENLHGVVEAWTDAFADIIVQEAVATGLNLSNEHQRKIIIAGLKGTIKFLNEWPEEE